MRRRWATARVRCAALECGFAADGSLGIVGILRGTCCPLVAHRGGWPLAFSGLETLATLLALVRVVITLQLADVLGHRLIVEPVLDHSPLTMSWSVQQMLPSSAS